MFRVRVPMRGVRESQREGVEALKFLVPSSEFLVGAGAPGAGAGGSWTWAEPVRGRVGL